jgi:excisionase family DNA binding protein
MAGVDDRLHLNPPVGITAGLRCHSGARFCLSPFPTDLEIAMSTPSRPHRPTNPTRRPLAAPTSTAPIAAAIGDDPLLYTPAEAARRLQIRESWLRKKAAAREIPCTFLGRHLRFSPADLATIVAACARPAVGRRGRRKPDDHRSGS